MSNPNPPCAGGDAPFDYDALWQLGRWLITVSTERSLDAKHVLDEAEALLQVICNRSRSQPVLRSAHAIVQDLLAKRVGDHPETDRGDYPKEAIFRGISQNVTGIFCPFKVPGLTIHKSALAPERTWWLMAQACKLAIDEQIAVTFLAGNSEGQDVSNMLLDIVRSQWGVANTADSAADRDESNLLATIETTPLDIGITAGPTLADVRSVVRRRARMVGRHQVIILDCGSPIGGRNRIIEAEYFLSGLNALSKEGCHIIVALDG